MQGHVSRIFWVAIAVVCVSCNEPVPASNTPADACIECVDAELDGVSTADAPLGSDASLDLTEEEVMSDSEVSPDGSADADVEPDASPVDTDGDGVIDDLDAFPDDETEWADTDGDGVGDNADDWIGDAEELEFGADCMVSERTRADTDGDEIPDGEDPYPRDRFTEFMLRANTVGSIDLFLSERDGTFREPIFIGEPIEIDGRALGYTGFASGDFDRDGRMDFVAHSTPLYPDIEGDTRVNFYFSFRNDKEDEFIQALIGVTDRRILGALVDANSDNVLDVARFQLNRLGYIESGVIEIFLNNYDSRVSCVYSTDPADLCFFHLASTVGISDAVGGEWIARMARQAVNLNPASDAHRDLTIMAYASGGNSPTDVYTLFGNGDGTFEPPEFEFTHNAARSQAPGNTYLFADFNGDGVGDILVGFDDDGNSGAAWTYLGDGPAGTFLLRLTRLTLIPRTLVKRVEERASAERVPVVPLTSTSTGRWT